MIIFNGDEMSSLKDRFTGFFAGILIILIAVNILGVTYGFPFNYLVSIDLVIIGLLLYLNSLYQKYREERRYYGFWGLFFIVVALGILSSTLTGNWVIGFTVVLAGIGAIILYNTFSGGKTST